MSISSLLKSLTGFQRTQWSYVTGASMSVGYGEALSASVDTISVLFRNAISQEVIKVVCTGGSVAASLSISPRSMTGSSFAMPSFGTSLWSRNPYWTQDRFAKTPWAVGYSFTSAAGTGWSGTILTFTHTRSQSSIETLLANAPKSEGFVSFHGRVIGTPGAGISAAIYPKIDVFLYTPSPGINSRGAHFV